MSIFVQATPARVPKTPHVRTVSLAVAGLLIIIAVAQLFTYEKFPAVIQDLGMFNGDTLTHLIAALIVTCEVLALPFLLSMRLSALMRIVSMVSGWLVGIVWLMASFATASDMFGNSGLLGDTIPYSGGWAQVVLLLVLCSGLAYAAWGMWPLSQTKGKRKS